MAGDASELVIDALNAEHEALLRLFHRAVTELGPSRVNCCAALFAAADIAAMTLFQMERDGMEGRAAFNERVDRMLRRFRRQHPNEPQVA